MKDPVIVDRADRVVNLLRVDELYSALEEFQIEDFAAGWNTAKNVYGPESKGPAISQADGSGSDGPGDAVSELHGCGCESAECKRGNEAKVEESPWLVKFMDCECVWDERSYSISLCKDHAYLVGELDSSTDL